MLPLHLPTLQNWSCQSCGGCCKQHAIEVTPEEKARIEGQQWPGKPDFEANHPIFVPHGGWPWNPRYRLAHREDGSCVFLDDKGLCRIHSQFGEPAKPLACRIYPYALHPQGKSITVSLRFSCPSVVANRGKPVAASRSDIQEIERLIVPPGVEKTPAPYLHSRQRLEWKDFLKFIEALDNTLAATDASVTIRLLRALFWMNLVGQADFSKLTGDRIADFLRLITEGAVGEVAMNLPKIEEPTSLGRMQFRMLCAQYARKDTSIEVREGWWGRWKLLRAAWKFTRGRGMVPVLQPVFREVSFNDLEEPGGLWPDGVDELLTRYLRVKIQGLHFCGPAYYGIAMVEGFQSLALIIPVFAWIARWLAHSGGRTSWTLDDWRQAVAIADHHHGYSPAFGSASFRQRVRHLARLGDIERLLMRYVR